MTCEIYETSLTRTSRALVDINDVEIAPAKEGEENRHLKPSISSAAKGARVTACHRGTLSSMIILPSSCRSLGDSYLLSRPAHAAAASRRALIRKLESRSSQAALRSAAHGHVGSKSSSIATRAMPFVFSLSNKPPATTACRMALIISPPRSRRRI